MMQDDERARCLAGERCEVAQHSADLVLLRFGHAVHLVEDIDDDERGPKLSQLGRQAAAPWLIVDAETLPDRDSQSVVEAVGSEAAQKLPEPATYTTPTVLLLHVQDTPRLWHLEAEQREPLRDAERQQQPQQP